MDQNKIDVLQRALKREKEARKAAERILEDKSRVLYETSQKLEQLLDEKSSQLQGVFENIIDAYVVMDLNGNVIKFNDAAIALFGYDINNEPLNVMSLIYKEDSEYAMESFLNLRDKGFFKNYEARVHTKSNQIKWVHINASVIFDKGKKPVAAQGIVRDITDIKNLEFQKEKLVQKLEKSNDELQEYAHIVSHDLKSPLRSINALVTWLKEDNLGKFDETSLQNFEHIETTLEKMELLISDVLTYSSLGDDKGGNVDVDTNTLVNDLISTLFIPDHIEVKVLSKLPIIRGDKTKLQQVFQNLISNAVKFIDKKKGIVEVKAMTKGDYVEFLIKDNGIGIDKKYHSKIFKIFHSINKSKDSTGIGLSIVKKIVALHDGKIWIESELNKGSSFYFTLKR